MAKILIVEDDNNLREIYGARLEAEGYEIVGASDGEEALAIAIRERPDLIISDVMMPKISGFDMLDILRSTPETKDVKVIVMTALSQDEDRRRGEQLGADRYVVKSQVTLDDVVTMVQEIVSSTPQQQTPSPQPAVGTQLPQQENPTVSLPEANGVSVEATVQTPVNTPDTALTEPLPTLGTEVSAPIAQPSVPDEKELVKEVENFVATSPLMNGVAPSSLSQQVVSSPAGPEQIAQIDNPGQMPSVEQSSPEIGQTPIPISSQEGQVSPEIATGNDPVS